MFWASKRRRWPEPPYNLLEENKNGCKSLVDLVVFDLGGTICDGGPGNRPGNIGPINAIVRSLKKISGCQLRHRAAMDGDGETSTLTAVCRPSVKAQFVANTVVNRTDDAMLFREGFKPILEENMAVGAFDGVIDMFKASGPRTSRSELTRASAQGGPDHPGELRPGDLIDTDVGADEVVRPVPHPS